MASQIAVQPKEAVQATPRRKISRTARARIFLACNGRCSACGEKITGAFEVDHCVELFLGAPDDLSNYQILHPSCHREKTNQRAPVLAKVRRLLKADEPRKPSRLQGRGFDRSKTRGFDGRVRPRKMLTP